MEKLTNLNNVIDGIKAINADAGEWLALCLGMLDVFREDYAGNTDLLQYLDLEADQDALLEYFDLIEDEAERNNVASILVQLQQISNSFPVYKWFLEPLFADFSLMPIASENNATLHSKKRLKFANVEWNLKQRKAFMAAMGFIEDKYAGKGGHTKWTDPKTSISVTTSKSSTKVYSRSVITQLVNMGIDLERIRKACDDLKFECTIIH